MFGIFKRRHISKNGALDLAWHVRAVGAYIKEYTQVKSTTHDPDIMFSLRDYGDSTCSRAKSYLSSIQKKPCFTEMILDEVKSQRLSAKEFYSRAGFDRKLFSAIKQGGRIYQPSRNTAIRCCLALRLSVERTEEVLKTAGYALSDTKRQDLIIRYCIENEIWNPFDVDELLYALGENILNK